MDIIKHDNNTLQVILSQITLRVIVMYGTLYKLYNFHAMILHVIVLISQL